jgi:hypothetical protein
MRWIRDFLVGIFSRHFGVKLLALLLSVGLFGFVQASLTGTQEVRQLKLKFALAEELKSQYVLLTNEIHFSGLTMTGLRSKVDPLAKLYSGNPVVPLTIDQRFLNLYGDGLRIPVNRALFRDEALFGKDIRVGEELKDGAVAVRLDLLDSREARVDVAPATPRTLKADHPYEGTEKDGRLAFAFNVRNITLIGPASAFLPEGDPAVLVSVPQIDAQLSAYSIPSEGRGEAPLARLDILWRDGNIDPALVKYLVVRSELGDLPAEDFQKRLEVSCRVITRKKDHTIPVLPVHIRYPQPPAFDLVADWDSFTPAITTADLQEGVAKNLKVRLPAKLREDKEFLANLVLVLNVGAAPPEEEGRLRVPYYVDLRDRSRGKDLENLAQVAILGANGEPEAASFAEFRKKPK